MKQKNDEAYKSIGEVAKDLKLVNPKTGKLNTHTIRFWEKEFNSSFKNNSLLVNVSKFLLLYSFGV